MGFLDNLNRAFFSLTYNPEASKAYDEQNQKAAGAVDELKDQVKGYRKTREKIIGEGKASDYFKTNSIARITEWENWIEKNAGLAAGDYSRKSTEMKTQWDGILNINVIVSDMGRIPEFLDLFLKDKDMKIPTPQKDEIKKLKADAEKYFAKINKETPADILQKREEFAKRFDDIQKKIPENFEDINNSAEVANAALDLAIAIQEAQLDRYKQAIENKEAADETTFQWKRLFDRSFDYFAFGFTTAWPYVFGTVFAMIVANDAIGRTPIMRFFYFAFIFLNFTFNMLPGNFIPYVIMAYYILYRVPNAVNFSNIVESLKGKSAGPWLDYMKAPVLFGFLPVMEAEPDEPVFWMLRLFKYSPSDYDGLAKKKKNAYLESCAKLVGKKYSEVRTLDQVMCDLKSALLNSPKDPFAEAVTALKKEL